METNSIGHENKYHLQVSFEDKTDPKNTEKKATLFTLKALLHQSFAAATTLLLQQQNILIKLHLDAITMLSMTIQDVQTALCPRCQCFLKSN